ncbi:MAG: erythromycin esterase family protein [Bacteroidota bacterium]
MKYSLVLLLCISLGAPGLAQNIAKNTDTFLNTKPFVDWAKDHAFLLQNSDSANGNADLRPFKEMIGNAQVVALGEPAHGFHEPLAFRNRLFRFLAENYGFTTIVLEADLAESRSAAEFVAGGRGTAKDAAAKLSIAGASPENIELLEWMRRYNSDPVHTRKLRFYGMDMELIGFPNDTTPSHAALNEAITYLKKVDAKEEAKIMAALTPFMNRLSVANYPKLTLEEQNTLTTTIDDLISLFTRERINFIRGSSEESYEWAYHNALVAQQTNHLVKATPPDQPGKIPPEAWRAVNARDSAMANNVMWVLLHRADGGKVFVYAHNSHVKNEVTLGGVWDAFAQPPNSMGKYLRSMLGNNLFIIGTSYAPSLNTAKPGSLDKALLQVDKPRFILGLKSAAHNPFVASWLAMQRPMEANTVSYQLIHVRQAFDAILFINKMRQ